MKYSLMEDCFLSYGIQRKHPNSLFFLPSIKMTHCESPASRIANKQRIDVVMTDDYELIFE